jgi:hypothetical protein
MDKSTKGARLMTDQEILDNAPEGATHIDGEYDFCKDGSYFGYSSKQWIPSEFIVESRSLADIKRIAELEKELDVEYVPYRSNMSISANSVVEMVEHIAELEDLAQMIIDAESADPRVILLMYNAWLLKAKSLKEQE